MCREEIVVLTKRKRELYGEQHAKGEEIVEAEQSLLFKSEEEQVPIQENIEKLHREEVEIGDKIRRSHIFGLKFTKSELPQYCMECYITAENMSEMSGREKTRLSGVDIFKCNRCGYSLKVDLTHNVR